MIEKDYYSIVKKPLVTEKNTYLAGLLNEYAFEVAIDANRKEIKEAVEKLFKVKVLKVNTLVCRQSERRLGRFISKRKLWKKALVKLEEGSRFDFIAS